MTESTEQPQVSDLQKLALKFVDTRSESSFAALYHRLRPGLRKSIQKYSFDEETAQEILSITLSKAYMFVHMYDPRWHFSTWVYRICQNECLMEIRRKNQLYSLDNMRENNIRIKPIEKADIMEDPSYEFFSEEEEFTAEKVYDEVMEELSNLPQPYRDVLEDREVHKLKYEEIAAKRNIKINTVRSRIHVAKKLIKQRWLEAKRKTITRPIHIKNVALIKPEPKADVSITETTNHNESVQENKANLQRVHQLLLVTAKDFSSVKDQGVEKLQPSEGLDRENLHCEIPA